MQPETAAAIIAALPPGIDAIGVFVNTPPESIARQAGLHAVQLHGDEPPSAIPAGIRAWKAFRVDAAFAPSQLDAYPCEAFLLDTPTLAYGGSGHTFDWSRARSEQYKIVLAGGLDAGNVRQAIEQAQPWGVDACSRLEIEPGRKDRRKVADFIRAALAK